MAADVSLATIPDAGAPTKMLPALRGKNLPLTLSRKPTTPFFTYGSKSRSGVPLREQVSE